MASGLRASFPRAILLNELCLPTSPTQPPAGHLAAPAAPSNSKKPVPAASVSLHPAPAVHLHDDAIRMAGLDERLRALAKVSGDYVPAASTCFQASSSGPSTLIIRVADVAESNVVRQIAAELGVPSDAFDVDVDSRIRPSTSYILTACNIADARADASGELAVKIALYVLQRTVLDASGSCGISTRPILSLPRGSELGVAQTVVWIPRAAVRVARLLRGCAPLGVTTSLLWGPAPRCGSASVQSTSPWPMRP